MVDSTKKWAGPSRDWPEGGVEPGPWSIAGQAGWGQAATSFRGDAIMVAIGRYLLLGLQTDVSLRSLGVLNKPPLKFSQLSFSLREFVFWGVFVSSGGMFPYLISWQRRYVTQAGVCGGWVRGNGERFYLRDSNRESGVDEWEACIQVLVLVSDSLRRGVKFPLPSPILRLLPRGSWVRRIIPASRSEDWLSLKASLFTTGLLWVAGLYLYLGRCCSPECLHRGPEIVELYDPPFYPKSLLWNCFFFSFWHPRNFLKVSGEIDHKLLGWGLVILSGFVTFIPAQDLAHHKCWETSRTMNLPVLEA